LLGGAEDDESLEVPRRAEGVHFEVEHGWASYRGGLRPTWNQPGDELLTGKKYDGLLPDELRRLKQLEDENNKLKEVVADLSLDKAMLQDTQGRMLYGPSRSASWLMQRVANRMCRHGGRAACFDDPTNYRSRHPGDPSEHRIRRYV
jgi:hypothetical protein